ncbi:hypothetical protein BJX99DRAFT_130021 [Aspergillus californicus]
MENPATMRLLYPQSLDEWGKRSPIWDWNPCEWTALYEEREVTSRADSPTYIRPLLLPLPDIHSVCQPFPLFPFSYYILLASCNSLSVISCVLDIPCDPDSYCPFYCVLSLTGLPSTDTSPIPSSFRSIKMAWFSKVHRKPKSADRRQKNNKDSKEADDTSSLAPATDKQSGRKTRNRSTKKSTDQAAEKPAAKPVQKQLPSKAVADLTGDDVEDMFNLSFEENPGDIWHLNASELHGIPEHLRITLTDFDLAFGKTDKKRLSSAPG